VSGRRWSWRYGISEGPRTGSSPGVKPQVSPGTSTGAVILRETGLGCRSLKRPNGWIRRRSRSCSSCRSAAAGTSTLTACNQRLRTRTRAPAAAARSLIAWRDAVGRANNQTETVVSGTRSSRRGRTGETLGRCAANPAGRNRSQMNRRTKTGSGDEGRGTGELGATPVPSGRGARRRWSRRPVPAS